MNSRLIVAIITSLIDEIIIIGVILWVLPRFDIRIPLWGLVLIVIAFVIYAVGAFIIGSRTLNKKPLPGLTSMIGSEGCAATPLAPKGFVRIKGELWEARAESSSIGSGIDITVISQEGLKLEGSLRDQSKQN
jgi:membrane-bound ClpP family serine protease